LFFRKVTTKSGDKEYTYLKLIENFREGNKVKQRVIANLGNLENMTPEKVQSLISGLSKICGLDPPSFQQLTNKTILDYGQVAAVDKIWQILNLDTLLEQAANQDGDPTLKPLVKLLVLNQIIKNHQRLPLNLWCKKLYLPELQGLDVTEESYNATIKKLMTLKDKLEDGILQELQKQKLINTNTVYCHLVRGKLLSQANYDESNFFDYNPVAENIDLAILTSPEGIPFRHRTFNGHFTDGETVPRRLRELQNKFNISNCVFVGDQHVITGENMHLLSSYGYDYIAGLEIWTVPEAKSFREELQQSTGDFQEHSNGLLYMEIDRGPARYLLCYSPARAARKNKELEDRLDFIEKELEKIKHWVANNCSNNPRSNFFAATNILRNHYCKRYFNCIYDEERHQFTYHRKEKVIEEQMQFNGKFLIKTNSRRLTAREVIDAYTVFLKLRHNFRQMRGYDRYRDTDFNRELISGQVQVCVISYLIEQLMELMLLHRGVKISAPAALEILEGIKISVVKAGTKEISLITPATREQREILGALFIDYNKLKSRFEGVSSQLAATRS